MADVVAHAQPKPIPGAGLRLSPPNNVGLPKSIQSLRSGGPLSLDTMSPVTQNGSFEFDRIIKSGEVLKRTRKTKSWKSTFLVLRPNLLSIYRDSKETKLRHQINLSDVTAVARQRDPKRKDKHVFGLFSPSRNFHLEAHTDKDAQEWVELIRREARMDEGEEEMILASPGGAKSAYHGFERTMNPNIRAEGGDDRSGGYSSSDAEAFSQPSFPLPKTRGRTGTNPSVRRPSQLDYSGAEGRGSYSDFSDSLGPPARLSALSLAHTDGRPSTSSTHQPGHIHSVYGPVPTRPPVAGMRDSSQHSTHVPPASASSNPGPSNPTQNPSQDERVIHHSQLLLLKPTHGVRQWKKVWVVLRPRALAIYKNEEEYRPLLIIPFPNIIDAVEIDAISKSKLHCLQVIGEERNYRFCAQDEETLDRWLGAFKSLLVKRRAVGGSREAVGGA